MRWLKRYSDGQDGAADGAIAIAHSAPQFRYGLAWRFGVLRHRTRAWAAQHAIGLDPGKIEVNSRGLTDKVEFLPKEINTAEMFVAFSKKSKCYEALRVGFAENIRADVEQGTVKNLLDAANKKFYQ